MAKKPKLPKRTDGGCVPFLNGIVCKPTTTGILGKRHLKLVGNGLVTIPAHIARTIPKMFGNLKPDHMLAYAYEVSASVQQQLCDWCDGSGWQGVNCYEDIIACSNCKGTGLNPPRADEKQLVKLGRFNHHPDPAIDFCIEVDCIEGMIVDLSLKMEKRKNVQVRIDKAMPFRTGGDEGSVAAKNKLITMEGNLKRRRRHDVDSGSAAVPDEKK